MPQGAQERGTAQGKRGNNPECLRPWCDLASCITVYGICTRV
eukprot:CAMPEP_0181205362 /NCGR_PEP_ID=MMETSP1096-20121128/20434_1 /TAXON_ID=156174 ORGANISM="Chrysochromulina ericina, Strain CCMP281" /NCGR_SAMPLE_ID=MMETSP1096 /ASSEMBLY_ACC=CAM_ASM_000453 /LENGTH=41 /DNA_ID= /DNA_START= /DNA_END= /DNA_ORIENTATION=